MRMTIAAAPNSKWCDMLAPERDYAPMAPVQLLDGTGRLRGACECLQTAIDAADSGDRVVVPVGRHVGDLYIHDAVMLAGANVGRIASSPRRSAETLIMGRVFISRHAGEVVLDGLSIDGSVEIERAANPAQRLVLRNCVVDGRDEPAALVLSGGSGNRVTANLLIGGSEEVIRVPAGFDNLQIRGNRIVTASGAVGIALGASRGPDRARICGNVIVGGDYGVLVEAGGGSGHPDDLILVTDNQFGEHLAGAACAAPRVAAVMSDDAGHSHRR